MNKTIVEVLQRVSAAFRGYAELPATVDDKTKGDAWLELCFAVDAVDGGGAERNGSYRGGVLAEGGIPMIMQCPQCRARHIDTGEFAYKPHHTHACQKCGFCWRPALVPTKGVRFLPGFKDLTVTPANEEDEA
jgi:hypothetical protein